jgi:hypothetical protein
MAIGDPTFPIISHAPDTDMCLAGLRKWDYCLPPLTAVGCYMFGYWKGAPMRIATANTCASMGFTAGVIFAYQNSYARIMGYRENSIEQRKFKYTGTPLQYDYKRTQE